MSYWRSKRSFPFIHLRNDDVNFDRVDNDPSNSFLKTSTIRIICPQLYITSHQNFASFCASLHTTDKVLICSLFTVIQSSVFYLFEAVFTNFGDICTLVNKYWALLQISNCSLFNLVTPHNKSYGGITIIAELKYSISKPWRKGFNLNWLTLTNVKIRANQRNKTVDANGFSLIFNYRRIHLFQIAFIFNYSRNFHIWGIFFFSLFPKQWFIKLCWQARELLVLSIPISITLLILISSSQQQSGNSGIPRICLLNDDLITYLSMYLNIH